MLLRERCRLELWYENGVEPFPKRFMYLCRAVGYIYLLVRMVKAGPDVLPTVLDKSDVILLSSTSILVIC